MSAADRQKRLAAELAVAQVEDGMILGLGTGSTAAIVLEVLAGRILNEGIRVAGIPTSERTAELARRLGVPLTSFAEHRRVDLTLDGADQVETGTLNLVKGLGGALLREKIVAAASRRMLVVVDESKLVPRLDGRTALPVEILPFGWQTVLDRLAELGAAPALRLTADGAPYCTDGGNHIADCHLADALADPAALERNLRAVVGVVDVGLFVGLATAAVVGNDHGAQILRRSG